MIQDVSRSLAVVQQQIAELDEITNQTLENLNTVAGSERVAKWKLKTVALLTDIVGREEGEKLAGTLPGPSFTNDLVEEFTDLADCYRTPLVALAKRLGQVSRPGS
jgi:hypothetical protein